MSACDPACFEHIERVGREQVDGRLLARARCRFAMATRIEADQLEALAQSLELVVPHFERRAERIQQQQRRRTRPGRMLDPELYIL